MVIEAEVVLGDHQLHAGEPAGSEAFQEGGPEGAVLAVADVDAQYFPVTIGRHARRDHHRPGHDPASDAALHIGGVADT